MLEYLTPGPGAQGAKQQEQGEPGQGPTPPETQSGFEHLTDKQLKQTGLSQAELDAAAQARGSLIEQLG
ncbi:MAG: hypothetical protein V1810_02425 [Candidatus Beckwithbacteria bacterium]